MGMLISESGDEYEVVSSNHDFFLKEIQSGRILDKEQTLKLKDGIVHRVPVLDQFANWRLEKKGVLKSVTYHVPHVGGMIYWDMGLRWAVLYLDYFLQWSNLWFWSLQVLCIPFFIITVPIHRQRPWKEYFNDRLIEVHGINVGSRYFETETHTNNWINLLYALHFFSGIVISWWHFGTMHLWIKILLILLISLFLLAYLITMKNESVVDFLRLKSYKKQVGNGNR